MGKGASVLCLLAGGFLAATGFGWLPGRYVVIHAPREFLQAGGLILALLGFVALAKDHRVSDAVGSLVMLAVASVAGWLTFVAPAGTAHRYFPFVPDSVNDALGRLLFGVGAAVCFGIGFVALRRLIR